MRLRNFWIYSLILGLALPLLPGGGFAQDKTKSGKSTASAAAQKKSGNPVQSRTSGNFTHKEIEQYKSMPLETWESPKGVSELGLPIQDGFVQPYPYGNLMRQYDGNKCRHRGLDIGAVGPVGGLGTVINAITKSKIILIGKAGGDVKQFGKKDTRTGQVVRTGGRKYPRHILVPGYGLVYPFSRNYGRWRSGTVIVTQVLEGPFKNYTIRYMHLADVRPDLKVGSIVEAGEHIAIMGGTAVMESYPHVHIDMETPDKKRVDPGPYIGLKGTGTHCGLEAPEVLSGGNAVENKSDPRPQEENKEENSVMSTEGYILRVLGRQVWTGDPNEQ